MSDLETWKPIPGTDGQYSASSFGRVRSEPIAGTTGRQRGRVLSPRTDRKGYLVFRICLLGGLRCQTRVHQAVAAAFIGQKTDGMQVNHIDGDKANNTPENLEYVSCRDNIRHGWVNGLFSSDHSRGEKNNHSRLTESEVVSIRAIYPAKSLYELAKSFGVSPQTISHIVNRKTWLHVP